MARSHVCRSVTQSSLSNTSVPSLRAELTGPPEAERRAALAHLETRGRFKDTVTEGNGQGHKIVNEVCSRQGILWDARQEKARSLSREGTGAWLGPGEARRVAPSRPCTRSW